MAVFVLDKRGKPLMPCSEKRARLLLLRGRARIHRVTPFCIRIVDRYAEDSGFQPLRLKIDPGSKITGVALTRETGSGSQALLCLFEIVHRGRQISEALTQRSGFRKRRRSANLRYRAPRFNNRRKPEVWIAPSLQHRVDTTLAQVQRLCRCSPVSELSMELVRFDTQLLQNPEISGVEYQQGELQGYELREYLLEKWGRKCAYCDAANAPLTIDHIEARSKSGSNRVTNLTLACIPCNQKKGRKDIRAFVKDPVRLARILKDAKQSLRDAAAVNITRNALLESLRQTGLAVETGTGGRTKWNRSRFGIPKSHALDAACVGILEGLSGWKRPTLQIRCSGRGAYKRTRLNKHGFPRGFLLKEKQAHGFQTGDRVRATVPAGRKAGVHVGRVAIRASGSFNIQTPTGMVQGISYRHCALIQRADGYGYAFIPFNCAKTAQSLPDLKDGVSLRG